MEVEFRCLDGTTRTQVIQSLSSVFRRLLSNLERDFDNPKYRTVKKSNAIIASHTKDIPSDFVEKLFATIGFSPKGDIYEYTGTRETLTQAEKAFDTLETEYHANSFMILPSKYSDSKRKHDEELELLREKIRNEKKSAEEEKEIFIDNSGTFAKEDFAEAEPLKETVKMTLLNTGRVRNFFFEARNFSVRVMKRGRVFECPDRCDCACMEAHWHIVTRNTVYSYIAHISSDGKKLLHLGTEYGYQYNSIPGTPNFRNTMCFSAKELLEDGTLKKISYPNKSVTNCIYCNRDFIELYV